MRLWLVATLVAACTATFADAVLLQLRRSYFTGGFLSVDDASRPSQIVAFVASSLAIDAAATGVLVALGLGVAALMRLDKTISPVLATCFAVTPIIISDVVNYKLASFLGDAFDLSLMMDLVGGDVTEFLAVSSEHLTSLALVGSGLVAAGALGCWFVLRRSHRPKASPMGRVSASRLVLLLAALVVMGSAATTGLRMSSDALDNGLRRKPAGLAFSLIVEALSDFDRDGFGLLGRIQDPDPFDARIRPWGVDIPGNGIDEDGIGGDLPLEAADLSGALPSATPAPWRRKPDVLLIVLETFRADAVGAVIEGRSVTPVLDALAARGVSVQQAYSHNGYTIQARHHIFSGGLGPSSSETTLIDDFRINGYQTAYFSAQDESYGSPEMTQAFQRAEVRYDARQDADRRYTTFSTPGSLGIPHAVLQERISEFLATRDRMRPLFMYVNFYDTHFPYHYAGMEHLVTNDVLQEAEIQPNRSHELWRTYLNAVANVDRAVGRLIAEATEALGSEPGIIITADHGESLFDEGFLGHGYALNDAQTRIPMIVVGLPLVLPEPMGQSDLRRAIREALVQPEPAASPSVAQADTGVFRYLGDVLRPAKIALTGTDGTIAYDFRTRKVETDDEEPQDSDDLTPDRRKRFLRLLHRWERLLLRAGTEASQSPE